jgi:hypothetical protein
MENAVFVIGSVVLVVVQLAVAAVHFDGAGASDKAEAIERELDGELRDLLSRSLDLELPGGIAEAAVP